MACEQSRFKLTKQFKFALQLLQYIECFVFVKNRVNLSKHEALVGAQPEFY